MSATFEALGYWLADYYAVSTCVLLGAVAVVAWLEQPARRLSIARSALVGLLVLLVLGTIPSWPRTGLLADPAPDPAPAAVPAVAVVPVMAAAPVEKRGLDRP